MDEKGDSRSDGELVAAVNAGDWAAFEVIYFRHRDWAFHLALRFCPDYSDAMDAVQDVFVYLAGKFPGFELRAGMTTFLYPAVKHTALAIRRKRRRGGVRLADDTDIAAPPEISDPQAARSELASVLAGLSDPHREVLLMRFVDDLSLEEIAQALAVPVGTVKSRLHHAIRSLREDPRLLRYFAGEI